MDESTDGRDTELIRGLNGRYVCQHRVWFAVVSPLMEMPLA